MNKKFSITSKGYNNMFNEDNDTIWKVCKILQRAGYEIAINKKNSFDFPIFHSSGTHGSVPDILFYNPNYIDILFNNEDRLINQTGQVISGFIETKKGDNLMKIFQGNSQLIQYYIYWITEQCRFFLDKGELTHVDIYLLGTDFSSEGMLYDGDTNFQPRKLRYLSDYHDILFYPYTHAIFSSLMHERKKNLKSTREKNLIIRRPEVELGVMFSRIPQFGNSKTEEYWCWTRNKIKSLTVERRDSIIKSKLEIISESNRAIRVKNHDNELIWLPKSQIIERISINDIGTTKELSIPSWLYNKHKRFFGLI